MTKFKIRNTKFQDSNRSICLKFYVIVQLAIRN